MGEQRMSIDIIPEGRTIDPLKIAYEKLIAVLKFLQKQDGQDFDDIADELRDVLDQFGGWARDSAQLDAKYPDDKYVAVDKEWRKKTGIL